MKPITGRNNSFSRVIEILKAEYSHPIIIVETGCIRSIGDECKFGDGWSTLNWEYYCKKTKSIVYTVDVSENSIAESKKIVPESIYVQYTQQDSIEYLQNFDKKIDVLFLDSYDYGGSEENIVRCHNHSLNELMAAWDKLNQNCYVLIDDVFDDEWTGKGKLSIPYLLNNGFTKVYRDDLQALFTRE